MFKNLLFSTVLITSLVLSPLCIENVESASKVTVVEKYYGSNVRNHYAIVKPLYVNVHSGPGSNYKMIGKMKHRMSLQLKEKMSNGWYRVIHFGTGAEPEYVDGKYLTPVTDEELNFLAEPVYPFTLSTKKAPAPAVSVPALSGVPSQKSKENFQTIMETLSFQYGTLRDERNQAFFAPNGQVVSRYYREVLRLIPSSEDQFEMIMYIRAWDNLDGVNDDIKKIPATVREILKFYFPTKYEDIYTFIYNGYHDIGDADPYLDTMFMLDNREFMFKYYQNEAILALHIGKPGAKYQNDFTLPAKKINVKFNNKPLSFPQTPFISEGRTLVPLRVIFEALGAKVNWDSKTMTVTATKGTDVVKLTAGQNTAYINGKSVHLEAHPWVRYGTMLVPLAFVSEAFGAKTAWDGATNTVLITNK